MDFKICTYQSDVVFLLRNQRSSVLDVYACKIVHVQLFTSLWVSLLCHVLLQCLELQYREKSPYLVAILTFQPYEFNHHRQLPLARHVIPAMSWFCNIQWNQSVASVSVERHATTFYSPENITTALWALNQSITEWTYHEPFVVLLCTLHLFRNRLFVCIQAYATSVSSRFWLRDLWYSNRW